MRTFLFCLMLALASTLSAQPNFTQPFLEISELSENDTLRRRVSVAMNVRAGLVMLDSTQIVSDVQFFERKFAAQIIANSTNPYFLSMFTSAALSQGVTLETPDQLLYLAINTLWPAIFDTWRYNQGYVTFTPPAPPPVIPEE